MSHEDAGAGPARINEIDPGPKDNAIFRVDQGGSMTGWVCVQNSPRQEWWLMRSGGSPLFQHPSPTSGGVSMAFLYIEGRVSGGSPAPFTGPPEFRAWVVDRTGFPAGQWALAVHSIS